MSQPTQKSERNMTIPNNVVRRPLLILIVLTLISGLAAPLLSGSKAWAGQLSARSVRLSDSAPSGGNITSGVGSGTNVEYTFSFTPTAATPIGGIVVDVCDNTPIIGDETCTAPAGFDWGAATPAATITSGLTNANWTPSAADTGSGTYSVLKFSHATSEITSGSITITVTEVTNPNISAMSNNTHSYYARIITFGTAADMNTYYPTTNTTRPAYASLLANMVDYGGVAMAATLPLNVTARVMETISLCTSATALTGAYCAGATTPSITIGHGDNMILDDTQADSGLVYSQVSTNAANGYSIYLRGYNACGGLSKDGGVTCEIPAVAAGNATGSTITPGTAAFGLTVGNGTAVTGGTGSNTAVTKWAGPNYLMDTTTPTDNVTYVYGSRVIESAGQANSVSNTFTFGATASPTTPAGIYTQQFSLIAAGHF